jgi:phosphoribosylformimino-5-aminoimidazole carboxamide ribotide isomerase
MLILPAIDIREGRVVRLIRGEIDKETFYSDDPVEVALRWEEAGAEIIHVVDLDGAFFGAPQNLDIIEKICDNTNIPIQMGGGLRNFEMIEKVMDFGVRKVVLGSVALLKPLILQKALLRFSPKRVLVGLDIKGAKLAIFGWQRITDQKVEDVILQMRDMGVAEVVITDIERDGMLTGPNIALLKEIAKRVPQIKIILGGGVSSLSDILSVKTLSIPNLSGIIIGKALYDGRIELKEALRIA